MADIFSAQKPNTPARSVGVPSPSTRRIEELQRRVPVVGDKALINLVNGIQVSKDQPSKPTTTWLGLYKLPC